MAGDRGLREQHFRVRPGQEESEEKCTALTESLASLNSKVVIKCWLDDTLQIDVKTRVPIYSISDSERKYELTFFSPEKRVAVCFWHTRADISNEKLDAIEENTAGTKTFNIVSSGNIAESEQYPEWLQKILQRQRYCLAINAPSFNYAEASMGVFIYEKDERGMWHTLRVCDAKLSEYVISNGQLLHFITDVEALAEETRNEFLTACMKRKNVQAAQITPIPKQSLSPSANVSSGDSFRGVRKQDSPKSPPMSLSERAIMISSMMKKTCTCGGKPVLQGTKAFCDSCGMFLFDLPPM